MTDIERMELFCLWSVLCGALSAACSDNEFIAGTQNQLDSILIKLHGTDEMKERSFDD